MQRNLDLSSCSSICWCYINISWHLCRSLCTIFPMKVSSLLNSKSTALKKSTCKVFTHKKTYLQEYWDQAPSVLMQLPLVSRQNFVLKELTGTFSQASDLLLRKLFIGKTWGGSFSPYIFPYIWKKTTAFEPMRNSPHNHIEQRRSYLALKCLYPAYREREKKNIKQWANHQRYCCF